MTGAERRCREYPSFGGSVPIRVPKRLCWTKIAKGSSAWLTRHQLGVLRARSRSAALRAKRLRAVARKPQQLVAGISGRSVPAPRMPSVAKELRLLRSADCRRRRAATTWVERSGWLAGLDSGTCL
jgi:hypothetical protein